VALAVGVISPTSDWGNDNVIAQRIARSGKRIQIRRCVVLPSYDCGSVQTRIMCD